MPEVVDLISSTPPRPPPPNLPQRPSSSHLQPPPSAQPKLISSDDFDPSIFAYDDFDDKPAKRRRLGEEPPTIGREVTRRVSTNSFLFSDDDFGLPSRRSVEPTSNRNLEESDPIVFTSSAPEPSRKPSALYRPNGFRTTTTTTTTTTITIDDDDDDDFGGEDNFFDNKDNGQDEIEEFSDQLTMPDISELMNFSGRPTTSTTTKSFSNRTANLLASLQNRSKSVGGSTVSQMTNRSRKGQDKVEDALDDDLLDYVTEPPKPKRATSKLTAAEKEAKARAREEAKAQRERDKQLEKERKQKLKEEKAKEKQLAADLSEVNKLKVDKKISTPEMILDIASNLEGTSVANQSVEFMQRLGVEQTFFTSTIPNMIKWRRKVVARFNETAGYWEPCPLRIEQEDHVLCLVPAQDFVDMVLAEDADSLEMHVLKIKGAYPGCKPIYLIEGLTAWMRKNQNSRNRAYQAEVLRQMDAANSDPPSASSGRRRKKANKPETTPPVDDDTIEDALLQLQVTHGCLIHHTNGAPESAEWIKNFTEHVSTIPYRKERTESNDAAFCMDVGQVKTGEDKADIFIKMLQEVNRVTASMAYGIVAQYPSVTDLVRGMRRHGPGMLEDVKKCANRNGALTESRVGPAASKRLYKVFMGLDPSSTDI